MVVDTFEEFKRNRSRRRKRRSKPRRKKKKKPIRRNPFIEEISKISNIDLDNPKAQKYIKTSLQFAKTASKMWKMIKNSGNKNKHMSHTLNYARKMMKLNKTLGNYINNDRKKEADDVKKEIDYETKNHREYVSNLDKNTENLNYIKSI